ncbi:MAG: hypothetical protein E7527_06475 [Ruminococcaceae bacterium]|nr:hypothetical protein [Oscillospiraceae bacterium]
MGQKLHRGRRSVFRKRRTGLKTFLGILLAVVIVASGYLAAMFLGPKGSAPVSNDAEPSASQSAPASTAPTTPSTPAPPEADKPVAVPSGLRGFYLPHAALTDDGLPTTLSAAKQAGFTAVVFDLKDTEGRLYYRFSSPLAKQVNSYTKNALTKAQLESLFARIKEAGLIPVPRLHAFRDNLGAKALPNARISYKENPSWSWFDGPNTATAKRWLSARDNDAHDYIGALAEELKALGAGAVMLDSVQFPTPRLTTRASFGNDNAELKDGEVLTLFISKMKDLLGKDCPVILGCTGESVLESATQVYGDSNPLLTFAPTVGAPTLNPTTLKKSVKESVGTLLFRIDQIEDESHRPTLAPLLEVSDLSAAQVKQAMADCVAGGTDSYILYSAKGTYDFAAYQ